MDGLSTLDPSPGEAGFAQTASRLLTEESGQDLIEYPRSRR
jgi:hypothetical protein